MRKIVPFLSCGKKKKEEPVVPKDDLEMLLNLKYQEGYAAALQDFIKEIKHVRSNIVLMTIAPAVHKMQMRVQKMKESERARD